MEKFNYNPNLAPFVQKNGELYVEDPMILLMVNFGVVFDSAAYANMVSSERKETTAIKIADDFDWSKPVKTYDDYEGGALQVFINLDHLMFAYENGGVSGNVLLMSSKRSDYLPVCKLEKFEFEGTIACSDDNKKELLKAFQDLDESIFVNTKNENLLSYVKENYVPKYADVAATESEPVEEEEQEPGEEPGEPEPEPQPEPDSKEEEKQEPEPEQPEDKGEQKGDEKEIPEIGETTDPKADGEI